MLNFTLKPGDYFMIGDDIKVVMAGGTANNCRIMVEAPREYNIVRSRVLEKQAVTQNEKEKTYTVLFRFHLQQLCWEEKQSCRR